MRPSVRDAGLQLRRGRELTGSQAWALTGCGLLLMAGTVVHERWLVPFVLAAALLAPGYAVVALLAAAVEYDSGEGLWRTLALRLVVSVAVWTVVGTLLVVLGVDPVHGARAVAVALVAAGLRHVVRHSTAAGVPWPASLVAATRSWGAVLGLRHVAVFLVGGLVLLAALAGAVRLATGGDPAAVAAAGTSAQAPYVSLAVPGGVGTLTPDSAGRSRVRVDVTGSRLPAAADRAATLLVRVDGRVRETLDVEVPATGSVTLTPSGRWGRCWRRAEVVLLASEPSSALAGLVPRPLTLNGPGLAGC